MTIRMVLTKAGVEEAQKQERKLALSYENGIAFFSLQGDLGDPSLIVPDIDAAHVEYVTYRDTIYQGHRLEGLYKHGKSHARIEIITGTAGQRISVRAPTLAAAQKM